MPTPNHPEFWNSRYLKDDTPWDFDGVPADLKEFLKKRGRGAKVLIPGCGSGYEIQAFAEAGYEVTAIDFSPFAVDRAKRLFESRWVRRLEDMEGQANYLAEWEALSDWRSGDEYLARALAVSAEGLTALARTYLDPEQVCAVVYRPDGTPEIAADADAWRALLDTAPAAHVQAPTLPPPPPPSTVSSAFADGTLPPPLPTTTL